MSSESMPTYYVGRPNISNTEDFISRTRSILDSRYLTNNGPTVKEFESKIASCLNVDHAIVTCNATVALMVAVQTLGLSGEVIVPSFTFIASVHTLQWQGITPIFVDIDPDTHCIDISKLEACITDRTTGIMGVNLWGKSCSPEIIDEIAGRYNLKTIYDSSHAFGCSSLGIPLGSRGNCEVFSFHATKFINCFEGGAITTNDPVLANKIRKCINFGFTGYDKVSSLGLNAKLNEISAAMGITNLESINRIISHNKENYFHYLNLFRTIPGISLLLYNSNELQNYQYVVAEVDESIFAITRDDLVEYLHLRNIFVRKYFWPGCHNMQPYASLDRYKDLNLPGTDLVSSRVIVFPTGTSISKSDIEYIVSHVKMAPYA